MTIVVDAQSLVIQCAAFPARERDAFRGENNESSEGSSVRLAAVEAMAKASSERLSSGGETDCSTYAAASVRDV